MLILNYIILFDILLKKLIWALNSCVLPDNCVYFKLDTLTKTDAQYKISCDLNTKFQFKTPTDNLYENNKCDIVRYQISTVISFYPQPFSNYILNENTAARFSFETLYAYLVYLNKFAFYGIKLYHIRFHEIKGFNLLLPETANLSTNAFQMVKFEYFKSSFDFYLNSKLVQSCSDLDLVDVTSTKFLNHFVCRVSQCKSLTFSKCDFKRSFCPEIFRNSEIDKLNVDHLVKSFYKTNLLQFEPHHRPNQTLNSIVYYFVLDEVENIDLDSNLLNPNVFEYLLDISVIGNLNKIQVDVFKSLRNLQYISLQLYYQREFFHRNGIEWIKFLNGDLNVSNLTIDFFRNSTRTVRKLIDRFFVINLYTILNYYEDTMTFEKQYPDEDFCLYRDFPFQQLVIIKDSIYQSRIDLNRTEMPTCTFLWITQYYPLYFKLNIYGFFYNDLNTKFYQDLFKSNNFD